MLQTLDGRYSLFVMISAISSGPTCATQKSTILIWPTKSRFDTDDEKIAANTAEAVQILTKAIGTLILSNGRTFSVATRGPGRVGIPLAAPPHAPIRPINNVVQAGELELVANPVQCRCGRTGNRARAWVLRAGPTKFFIELGSTGTSIIELKTIGAVT